MTTPLQHFNAIGHHIWLDGFSRGLIESGEVGDLIASGVTGMTTNPALFMQALADSRAYEESLVSLYSRRAALADVYDILLCEDAARAADLLKGIYERSEGRDGYVSIEVSPTVSHDTGEMVRQAHTLVSLVRRPNVMIKIPATPEGIAAIPLLVLEGMNINATLIFTVDTYEQVLLAYISGLESRVAQGKSIKAIASVASIFVSRWDKLVDTLIGSQRLPSRLKGKVGIANAKLSFNLFSHYAKTPRVRALISCGGQLQSPLWASMRAKDSEYSSLYYVQALAGPGSISTLPLATLHAILDSEPGYNPPSKKPTDAYRIIQTVESLGFSLDSLGAQLLQDGLTIFSAAHATALHHLAHLREDYAIRKLRQVGGVARK